MTDLVAYAPRLPKLGETLAGTRFAVGFGGKGANQAVMAARLGAHVSMVGMLGDDTFGRDYLENFRVQGVDVAHVGVSNAASTGVAPIWVDESTGNNAIVIVPGTNALLTPADVEAASDTIAAADVVVCQWEIPIECVTTAFRIARDAGTTTVFNPAPAQPDLPDEIYAQTDVLCPNESETELLTGMPVSTRDEVEAAARELIRRGARSVVCTLGERGSLLVDGDRVGAGGVVHLETDRVDAIDTTGAGDAFVGSLAFFLGRGVPLADAAARAGRIATRSVLRHGTQTSFPTAAELPPDLLA